MHKFLARIKPETWEVLWSISFARSAKRGKLVSVNTIINELLDFARKEDLDLTPQDIAKIANNSLELLGKQLEMADTCPEVPGSNIFNMVCFIENNGFVARKNFSKTKAFNTNHFIIVRLPVLEFLLR